MYADIEQDRNTRWVSPEGKDALTVLQLSLQYYQHAQTAMRAQVNQIYDFYLQQLSETARLQQVLRQKKLKRKRLV